MMMRKFVHALNVMVVCIGMENFGSVKIATIQKKIES